MEAVEYKNIIFSRKTMMLYKLELGEVVTIPNIEINLEAVEYKNISFSGKTTILYKLELGEVVTIPNIGINFW